MNDGLVTKMIVLLLFLTGLTACNLWRNDESQPTGKASYTISGAISYNGTALAGVPLALAGTDRTTTTDANGAYTFTSLPKGTYSVTPALAGYSFTPAQLPVTINGADQFGQDFIATIANALDTYLVSGTITRGGSALSGVTVSLSGTASGRATTDATGAYLFTFLANGPYTITPTLAGYTFSPENQAVIVNGANQAGLNFTASGAALPPHSLSGRVTSEGKALPGVTVSLAGTATASTTSDANGSYLFPTLQQGTYTITPAKLSYTFTPPNLVLSLAGTDLPGNDFTATYQSSNSDLNGPYTGTSYTMGGNSLPAPWRQSSTSDLTADGNGKINQNSTTSDSRSGANQNNSSAGIYHVQDDGTTSIANGTQPPIIAFLNKAGDIFVAANIQDASERHIGLMIKKGTAGFSNASLNGKYAFASLGQTDPWGPIAMVGTLTFNGVGSYTLDGTSSQIGLTANLPANATGSYIVNGDGSFTMSNPLESTTLAGFIKDTGEILTMACTDSQQKQLVFYAIKTGTSNFTNASLNGTYHLNNLALNIAQSKSESCLSTFTFDGAGGYSASGQCSPTAGTTPTSFSSTGTYSVNGDGTLSFVVGPDTNYAALSLDGNALIYGSVSSNSGISFGFGIKR